MATRSRRTKKAPQPDPLKEIAGRMEVVKDQSARNMFARLKEMRRLLGKRPYQGLPVDQNELNARYMQIRNDPVASMQVAQQNVKSTKDGRVLVSKEFIRSIIEIEAKLRQGGL